MQKKGFCSKIDAGSIYEKKKRLNIAYFSLTTWPLYAKDVFVTFFN